MKNEYTIEPLQVVKHYNNFTFFVTVRHIDQIIQVLQKLQGTILIFQYMDSLFFGGRISRQIGHEDPLGILHGLVVGIDEQRRWRLHVTSPLCICRFLGVLFLLYDGLNVTLNNNNKKKKKNKNKNNNGLLTV